MRFATRSQNGVPLLASILLFFLVLLSPLGAQPVTVTVSTQNPDGQVVEAELYVRGEGKIWKPVGVSGRQFVLQPGEYRLNQKSKKVNFDLILRREGYLDLVETVSEDVSESLRIESELVPSTAVVTMQTKPPGCKFYHPKEDEPEGYLGQDPLSLDSAKFLMPNTPLGWAGPAYRVRSVDVVARKPGYRDQEVVLGPEFWSSKVYPPEAIVLTPEGGLLAFYQRNPARSWVLLSVSGVAVVVFGVLGLRTRRRLLFARKLEGLRADSSDPWSGSELGSYRLGQPLGEGGMSAVYIGVPIVTLDPEQAVAVKIIHRRLAADPDFLARFHREVQVSGALTHPNIVELVDWGNQDGVLFMILELVKGESLARRLKTETSLPEILDTLISVARALVYAHQQGVIHRDIKPENVMIAEGGEVKVMDFGIAKKHDATTITATGAVFGTPAYLPPEQAKSKEVTAAADQYSFGVMAYEMLAGELPFKADEPLQMILKHLRERPPSLTDTRPELPESLAQLVDRMLSREPADRHQSMEEVLIILEAVRVSVVPTT
jgi:protein kinase-like protein